MLIVWVPSAARALAVRICSRLRSAVAAAASPPVSMARDRPRSIIWPAGTLFFKVFRMLTAAVFDGLTAATEAMKKSRMLTLVASNWLGVMATGMFSPMASRVTLALASPS
jgi:hypothetical protein